MGADAGRSDASGERQASSSVRSCSRMPTGVRLVRDGRLWSAPRPAHGHARHPHRLKHRLEHGGVVDIARRGNEGQGAGRRWFQRQRPHRVPVHRPGHRYLDHPRTDPDRSSTDRLHQSVRHAGRTLQSIDRNLAAYCASCDAPRPITRFVQPSSPCACEGARGRRAR